VEVRLAPLPPTLRRQLLATPPPAAGGEAPVPGLIMGLDPLLQRPGALAAFRILHPEAGAAPLLVVPPERAAAIFRYANELDLAKTIAAEVLRHVDPKLKTGIDAVWLVYRAAKLYDEWQKPGSDAVNTAFGLTGLGLSGLQFTGGLAPDLKLPDAWANGVSFLLRSGQAVYAGRTPPINEMVLAQDRRLAIPLKLLKVAGIALDPPVPGTGPALVPLPKGPPAPKPGRASP
jgi:hypothetical protein